MNGNITIPAKAIGLTSKRATKLLKEFGSNELTTNTGLGVFRLTFRQFISPLIGILAAAAFISFTIGAIKDAILIVAIIFLNAALGFWQEFKAEKALQALKNVTVAKTRVIRDGVEIEIPNSKLVPGDLVVLSEGKIIPADAKILEGYDIEVNESALTGESLPVLKVGLDEDTNQVYMGTTVTSGRARAVVTDTGMHTRFGKLAGALKQVKNEPTPFQRSMTKLAKILAVFAILAAGAVYFVGVVKGMPALEVFLVAASLAVAAVPEGLPAIVGLALAIGVQRMASRKAVVRKMSSVEALGAVTYICTDKTGTITSGKMRVRHVWYSGSDKPVSDLKGKPIDGSLMTFLEIAVIDNTSSLVMKQNGGSYDIMGSPTDGSLLVMAAELGVYEKIKNSAKVLDEFPLEKKIKLISGMYEVRGEIRALVRGAPERVLSRSVRWLKDGKEIEITDDTRERLRKAFEEYAEKGFRVVGLAQKNMDSKKKAYNRSKVESDLTYVGFVAIADPPRPEAKTALGKAKSAGVKTMMLTGDNILTAKAIGEEVGLLEEGDQVVLGEQIDKLTDEELDEFTQKIKIVARATPEQKLRVIQSLQRNQEIVAVTGDGINDSLALKQADVGVAMGITGTDVAKQASDIILTDDQYPTIVSAIEEGRRIDDNLTQVVRYLVAGNLSEILTVLLAVIFISADGGFTTPLLPVQILWVNIVTDALPAFALAVGPASSTVMKRNPKKKGYKPLNNKGIKWVFTASILIALITLFGFYMFLDKGMDEARTVAFTVLIIGQMIMALVVASSFNKEEFGWRKHKWLLLAILGTLAIQIIMLFVPALRNAFHLVLPW